MIKCLLVAYHFKKCDCVIPGCVGGGPPGWNDSKPCPVEKCRKICEWSNTR